MIRLFILLISIGLCALGLSWLAERPGVIELTFQGVRYETSVFVGVSFILLLALALALSLWLLRVLFTLPQRIAHANRERRKNKGLDAITRGLLAVSAGEVRLAQDSAQSAARLLPDNPLALLLQAQALQISGQSDKAASLFTAMMELPETRLLALRGLHSAARQRGDYQAALSFAGEAQKLAPASWASQAVFEHYTRDHQWERAISVIESAYGHKIIDKPTLNRQKAVLLTALAMDLTAHEPELALKHARQALKLAPDLVPACVLTGRLLRDAQKMRATAKILEAGWQLAPHPDIAQLYIELRSGDSAQDRLQRAQKLLDLNPQSPDARLAFAHVAIDARHFDQARATLIPLISAPVERPTRKVCLAMARLEDELQKGSGLAREWLARAARAPLDPAWIADAIISDSWAPLSPISGKIDAFVWQTPAEQLSSPIEPLPHEPVMGLNAPSEPHPPAENDTRDHIESAGKDQDHAEEQASISPLHSASEAQLGPSFKTAAKTHTEAPIKGLNPDRLRHFTAPDDPGPEEDSRP